MDLPKIDCVKESELTTHCTWFQTLSEALLSNLLFDFLSQFSNTTIYKISAAYCSLIDDYSKYIQYHLTLFELCVSSLIAVRHFTNLLSLQLEYLISEDGYFTCFIHYVCPLWVCKNIERMYFFLEKLLQGFDTNFHSLLVTWTFKTLKIICSSF